MLKLNRRKNMHLSVPINSSVEPINFTQLSPLVSKCHVKVLYVGENRNGTYISREVASNMGAQLPGSPIVGFFNREDKDFEAHNRDYLVSDDGDFLILDTTKAYGFVPPDAKVWFQSFMDDNKDKREYLVTEAYLWTGVYPEAERCLEMGNNQSMELTDVQGEWSVVNGNRVFIINEALIGKLCILGENFEPCFEGAQIKEQFALETERMMFNLKNMLEGGLEEDVENLEPEVIVVEEESTVVEEPVVETIEEEPIVEQEPEITEVEEPAAEDFEKKDENAGKNDEEEEDKTEVKEEEEKKDYSAEYELLKSDYEALQAQYATLEAELGELREYKLAQDRIAKNRMIDSFYMLSDEDKADVIANIDTYSLDDIEAKLSVICVRTKAFGLDTQETKEEQNDMSFSLEQLEDDFTDVPAWVKAVKETASRME